MGCGATRLDEEPDIYDHHMGLDRAFEINAKFDLNENPNTGLMASTNYYRGQKPDEGKEFDDDLFPPENQSLKGKYQLPLGKEKIEWKTAHKIWGEDVSIFGETISLDDITLGEVQDTYFIAAIKALANYPSIIMQLFKTTSLPKDDSGIQIFLKIEGVWTIYIIDDNFPVSKETGKTIFCDSPTKHIWAVLLEKAWAKANLGYANIIKGLPIEVFRAFTPFCIIPIDVPKEDHESLWENIKQTANNNCIMTATTKEGTKGIEDVGLIKNNSYILLYSREIPEKNLKMLKLLNPLEEGEWIGPYTRQDELWTDELRTELEYPAKLEDEDIKDRSFYITFDDLRLYFYLINILIPLRPCICKTINIPKENAGNYNLLKIKFEDKGVFSFSIERQITRFHKDLKEDYEMIENVLLAKIYKEDKRLILVDTCFNETLSTRVEPGEYLVEFNLDYKTIDVKDIRPYNIHIASSTPYKLKLIEPDDKKLTLLKTIMVPKIESLYKYKTKFKEPFVFFSGNRFGSSSYGFCYMKNQSRETKYLKPYFFIKNMKSIDGELPKALKMEPESKFFCLYNRFKVNLPFQTGIKPGFCKLDEIQHLEIAEPEVPEYADDKYFIDNDYEDAKPDYNFMG
jgi:hypothetical protein